MFHRIASLFLVLVAIASVLPPQPAAAAKPITPDVEIAVLSVVPGTLTGDNYWCVGDGEVVITAHVVDVASQAEITEGWFAWQVCQRSRFAGAVPKEECEDGSARWQTVGFDDISVDPTLRSNPPVPVIGFRVRYGSTLRSSQRGVASEPFNLDTTCGP